MPHRAGARRAPRTRAKLVPSALWTSGVSTGARGRGAGAAGAAATRMWMGTGGVADTTCYTLAVNRQKERRLGRGELAKPLPLRTSMTDSTDPAASSSSGGRGRARARSPPQTTRQSALGAPPRCQLPASRSVTSRPCPRRARAPPAPACSRRLAAAATAAHFARSASRILSLKCRCPLMRANPDQPVAVELSRGAPHGSRHPARNDQLSVVRPYRPRQPDVPARHRRETLATALLCVRTFYSRSCVWGYSFSNVTRRSSFCLGRYRHMVGGGSGPST